MSWWPWGKDEVDPNTLPAEAPGIAISEGGEPIYDSETDGCEDCGRRFAELAEGESMFCSGGHVICSGCGGGHPDDANGRDFRPEAQPPGDQERFVR